MQGRSGQVAEKSKNEGEITTEAIAAETCPRKSSTNGDSIGNNSTTSLTNSVATDATNYASLIFNNNVAQNSWKPHWYIAPFDPTMDGTYTFQLDASNESGILASTSIDVIIGAGGAAPEPTTFLVWSLLGLVRDTQEKCVIYSQAPLSKHKARSMSGPCFVSPCC